MGGEYPAEFRGCQVDPADRGARADEAIGVMRSLWTGAPVDNPGKFWPFEGLSIAPPPVQASEPPIIVAGRKRPAMHRAALLGDGWMPFLYSPSRYAESVRAIRSMAADRGRDLAAFQWMTFVYVHVDDDRDEARRKAAAFIGAGQQGDGSRFAPIIDHVAAAGTGDDVRARLQAFLYAGARHLIIVPCETRDFTGAAKRIALDIIPGLEVPSAAHLTGTPEGGLP